MKKTVIFDFDGTLVDSLPVVLEIAAEVADVHLSPEEIEKLRNLPAKEVIKVSGVSYLKIPRLLIKGKQLLAKRLGELKVFEGIPEVTRQLHAEGYRLCVLSSNSSSNIRRVLQNAGIEGYFDNIYGNVGLFSKAGAIRKAIRLSHADPANTIYIGDEVRDIEAAKKSSVPIASVTWGYNAAPILQKYQPNFLVSTPEELRKVISIDNQA